MGVRIFAANWKWIRVAGCFTMGFGVRWTFSSVEFLALLMTSPTTARIHSRRNAYRPQTSSRTTWGRARAKATTIQQHWVPQTSLEHLKIHNKNLIWIFTPKIIVLLFWIFAPKMDKLELLYLMRREGGPKGWPSEASLIFFSEIDIWRKTSKKQKTEKTEKYAEKLRTIRKILRSKLSQLSFRGHWGHFYQFLTHKGTK